MSAAAAVITRYIELVGAHELDPLDDILSDTLVATTANGALDKAAWIAALRRLLPVLVRNEIRQVYLAGPSTGSGAKACAIYDFVTDTEAGAVTCAERITLDADGRIAAVELLFEKANWAHVIEALKQRA